MSLIDDKYQELVSEFGRAEILRRIRDAFGVYALEIRRPNGRVYLFAAKRSMNGTIVSVHKDLWDESVTYKKSLILAIDKYFYSFLPKNLALAPHHTNLRTNGSIMTNFSLIEACGKNLRDQKAIRQHPVAQILSEQLELMSQ